MVPPERALVSSYRPSRHYYSSISTRLPNILDCSFEWGLRFLRTPNLGEGEAVWGRKWYHSTERHGEFLIPLSFRLQFSVGVRTTNFAEREAVGGRGWYHSIERWWVDINLLFLYQHSFERNFRLQFSRVCEPSILGNRRPYGVGDGTVRKSVAVFAEFLQALHSNFSSIFIDIPAVGLSTRPPDGVNYCLGPAGLCPPYLSRFAHDLFSRPFGPLSGGGKEFY